MCSVSLSGTVSGTHKRRKVFYCNSTGRPSSGKWASIGECKLCGYSTDSVVLSAFKREDSRGELSFEGCAYIVREQIIRSQLSDAQVAKLKRDGAES